MVLVFIVYSNAVDDEMVEMVKEHAGAYTKFIAVQGEGSGEPHLGSHVWPGVNNCMMVATDEKALGRIKKEVKDLKSKFKGVGIHVMAAAMKKVD
ncbi:MAG: hypothetical protein JXN64_05785 [Spirochaetes bacterium]|nr:hypothetical protein [Spirochaetota bacterium]